MSAPIDDGGPAFPQTPIINGNGEVVTSGMYFAEGPGMSLRDWFAGQAMAGILFISNSVKNESKQPAEKLIATTAYLMADAMLAARKENK